MASAIANVIKLVTRAKVKRAPAQPERLVVHLRKSMGEAPYPTMLPRGVRLERNRSGALRGDALRVNRPRQAMLYLHGGGYVAGRPAVYRNLCARFAAGLDADVWVPEYRLAPENPYPAGLDDALASYDALLALGWSPSQVSVAGDSAGGGMTLALLLALRDADKPLPRCAVVMSPLADLTGTAASIAKNTASDAMLSQRIIHAGAGLYAPMERCREPLISPAFGDFRGLCPLFVTVCEQECLRDDAYAVLARANEAGVVTEFVSREDLLHVWPIFVPLMREAREDVARMVAFIERQSR